ncbi:MAG: spore germination protein [Candidatus Contubernalis sp.]|nr:spore germination protein [Candidatus Contubernalis sp.]
MRFLLRKIQRIFITQSKKTGNNKQPSGSNTAEFDNIPATSRLSQRTAMIKTVMGSSLDVVIREIVIGDESKIPAAVIYLDGIVDKNTVFQHILRPLMFEAQSFQTLEKLSPKKVFKKLIENRLSAGEVMEKENNSELFTHLVGGDTIILIDGHLPFIAVSTRAWEGRGVEEPENESTIRGPREGFTETLKVNMSQLRRRIKSPHLRFDSYYIGRISQTTILVTYLNNLANPKLVKEVKQRLERINTDHIMNTGDMEEFLEDNPFSPFPQAKVTERPDVVAAGLFEGRVALLIENTPFNMILPTTFFEHLQAADDYYQRPWFGAALFRWLRMFAFNVALLLPSIYIAVTTFHQELIPTPLLVSLAGAREGVPFPAVVEALIMEVTFELLREAGLRLPASIGTAVSIVGALVLGDAAIRAGIVSPAMVIVVALTAISTFSIPGFAIALSLRQMRFPLMLLAATLGLFGVMFGLLVILIHITSLRSFGVPYMAPLAPLMPRDLKDIFMRPPFWAMNRRPRYVRSLDPVRQGENLMPRPPQSDKSGEKKDNP